MTTRAIRRLRRPSTLRPNSLDAPPQLKHSYRVWGRLVGRYRRWIERGRKGVQPLDDRWIASFDHFYADLGPAPADHIIRPADPAQPLGPGNYRWAPRVGPAPKGPVPRLIPARGVQRSIREWAEILGITEHQLRYRLSVGASVEDLLAQAESTLTTAAA